MACTGVQIEWGGGPWLRRLPILGILGTKAQGNHLTIFFKVPSPKSSSRLHLLKALPLLCRLWAEGQVSVARVFSCICDPNSNTRWAGVVNCPCVFNPQFHLCVYVGNSFHTAKFITVLVTEILKKSTCLSTEEHTNKL